MDQEKSNVLQFKIREQETNHRLTDAEANVVFDLIVASINDSGAFEYLEHIKKNAYIDLIISSPISKPPPGTG